jgi:hypothetical protein
MSDRYAIVEDGKVVNVIVADNEFIITHCPEAIVCPEDISVGDFYIDGEFSLNRIVVEEETIDETL